MALENCLDCRKQVSSGAMECPHCGKLMLRGKNVLLIRVTMVIVLVVLLYTNIS